MESSKALKQFSSGESDQHPDVPGQNPFEKLQVSFSVAGPVLLDVLKQEVLQCEGAVFAVQVSYLGKHGTMLT